MFNDDYACEECEGRGVVRQDGVLVLCSWCEGSGVETHIADVRPNGSFL